jgi:hypothetical protein
MFSRYGDRMNWEYKVYLICVWKGGDVRLEVFLLIWC